MGKGNKILSEIKENIDKLIAQGLWTPEQFINAMELGNRACKGDVTKLKFIVDAAEPEWLEVALAE